MERVELEATLREQMGKGASGRLRREGLLPAVVYGPRMDPVHVALNPVDMRRVLASGDNVLVNLKIRAGKKAQNRLVMVKDYDLHPLTDRIRHVDLYEISLEQAIQVEIAIALKGDAPGVVQGGILSPLLRVLEVSCLPEQIPEKIEVDCSALEIGDTVHVSDLKLPPEIKVMTDPSTAVVTVTAPEAEKEEVVAAEAEAEVEAKAPSEEEPEA